MDPSLIFLIGEEASFSCTFAYLCDWLPLESIAALANFLGEIVGLNVQLASSSYDFFFSIDT
jgi:hypothetical protein